MFEVNNLRIKEVCKKTGLTDKAIRVYINSGLLNPNYTENYAGRKNFDFSDEDVEVLKRISLLRRYNFSLNGIKELIYNEKSIDEILQNQIEITKTNALESTFVLTNLNNAFEKEPQSIIELCDILNENIEPVEFDLLASIKNIWSKFKKKLPLIMLIVILGVAVSVCIIAVITVLLSKLLSTL